MNASFWKRIDRLPPVAVRMLARQPRGRPLTNDEVAERSGLTHYQVAAISHATSWDSIPVGQMRAFLLGCGVDFCDRRTMKRVYMQVRRGFKFLLKAPNYNREIRPLYESVKRHTPAQA